MGRFRSLALGVLMVIGLNVPAWADDEQVFFAVVSDVPKDKTRISAKVLQDGASSDIKLIPSESVVANPVWRTLEVCHALKIEGMKIGDGLKVMSARVLDASMLPMGLQGFAGDCLIKKAVEIAPLAE
ncbi:MAG: hypothetical protein K1X60_01215 [Nitrospira sp.]|nr:hypothetical protein [Nitrospira sp.]MCW5795960.1 hypothetical protein [Nitrospira sp.]HMU30367.1 hypothetical protein [Nitrospira sp.]HMW85699.1 hypothetical protein [Nitrospira sp.]HMZ95446.1 hypothetical protein [Nitrospira sp.]